MNKTDANRTIHPLLRTALPCLVATMAMHFLPTPAQATFISVDYLAASDGLLTHDTLSGLEWLDITLTLNRSVAEVVALTGAEGPFSGFRLATAGEFRTLYANAGLTTSSGPSSPNATSAAYIANTRALQDLLGYAPVSDANAVYAVTAGYLFGSSPNFGLLSVTDITGGFGTDYYRAEAYHVSSSKIDIAGLYLVRNSAGNLSVPENGSTVALLGGAFGVLGIACRRYRMA